MAGSGSGSGGNNTDECESQRSHPSIQSYYCDRVGSKLLMSSLGIYLHTYYFLPSLLLHTLLLHQPVVVAAAGTAAE